MEHLSTTRASKSQQYLSASCVMHMLEEVHEERLWREPWFRPPSRFVFIDIHPYMKWDLGDGCEILLTYDARNDDEEPWDYTLTVHDLLADGTINPMRELQRVIMDAGSLNEMLDMVPTLGLIIPTSVIRLKSQDGDLKPLFVRKSYRK